MTYNLPEVRPALCRPWASVDGKPPSQDQVWDELCQRILLRGTQRTVQPTNSATRRRSALQRLPHLVQLYQTFLSWVPDVWILTWNGLAAGQVYLGQDTSPDGRCLVVQDADAAEVKSWRRAKQTFDERWGNVACDLRVRCLVRECIEESQPAMKTERRDLFAWQDLLTLERRNTSALKCGHCSAIKPLKGSHHDNLRTCARTDTTRSTHPASRPSGRTSPSTATASRSHI